MNGPEQLSQHEVAVGNHEAAAEQAEILRKREATAEKAGEHSGEKLVADARKETEGVFAKERSSERRSGGEPSASPSTIRKITKREKQRVYKETLVRIQSEMTAPARTFSKIIHAPIVEKTSNTIGSTVARPNALLVGGMTAFIAISIMYVVGRMYGYQLSGFEMIGAYIIGWTFGLLLDYFRVMATGKTAH